MGGFNNPYDVVDWGDPWTKTGQPPNFDPLKKVGADQPCPPGQERHPTRGDCRFPGDYPCPAGQCKDVASGMCRSFNANREKVNETDTTERASGGGRGYCRKLDGGGGGRGGGGGVQGGPGGPGGPGGDGYGIQPPGQHFNELFGMFEDQQNQMWDTLSPIMAGSQTRYSPEVMAQLDSQAKLASQGAAKAGMDSLTQDAIRRGMGRSPDRGREGVQRQAVASYTQAANANRVRKAETDFEDKMRALDAAQKWLGQMQTYVMGLDATAADREKAIASIALGYARIQAEKDMLGDQLRNNLEVAEINNNPLNDLFGNPGFWD